MKKRLICLLLAGIFLLNLAACSKAESGTTASSVPAQSSSAESLMENGSDTPAVTGSYIYEFQGMMGAEKAQFDLEADGTCRFFLPENTMITDVYAGTYTCEGETVTVTGLKNVDEASQFTTPGLWDWITDGSCTILVDVAAGTFLPEGGGEGAPAFPGVAQQPGAAEDLKNVAYASGSAAQVCDIYLPEGVEKAPVIVLVHGGGFLFGDQGMEIIQPVIEAGTAHGYAVVSVDYRKSSEAVFPAALADVKAAVRFVRSHAAEYGFDAEHIAVWGESAGAYLSLMTALTPDVEELNGDVSDNADASSGVTALVSFYAPVEFYTLYEEAGKPDSAAASFESKFLGQDITADKEAVYKTYWETYSQQIPADLKAWIQAGDSDQRVPCTQSVNFAQRLADVLGAENVEHSLLPGADHEDDAFYTQENLDAVFAWLDPWMR